MPKVKNLAPLLVRAETLNRSVLDNLGCISCDNKGLLALTDYLGQAVRTFFQLGDCAQEHRVAAVPGEFGCGESSLLSSHS
ncbi:MAG: hypothetical protein K2W95_34695 [Candidatus Obscuribacterales bacterium]|nr:hypothetical protein [Candidatus Obscuribacterales bacterium]